MLIRLKVFDGMQKSIRYKPTDVVFWSRYWKSSEPSTTIEKLIQIEQYYHDN